MTSCTNNYNQVLNNIKNAANEVNRSENDIKLIAVSKTKPASLIQELYENGCRDFGENYVQELLDKYDSLPKDIRWHMIGHLQTNKVKYIVDKVYLIHSVDSYKLAETIDKEAKKKNLSVNILLEVNVAGESTKFGFNKDNLMENAEKIASLSNVNICGLMTSAPYVENQDENAQYFVALKGLLLDIMDKLQDNIKVSELSMGMTNDYICAIKHGATYVRVGTAIFGARDYT